MSKLTATAVKHTKPSEKPQKIPDGGGMYLLVTPAGGRYWRYDYRYAGKRKTLALGVYPDISLADARDLHREARMKLAKGSDPGEERKLEKLTRQIPERLCLGYPLISYRPVKGTVPAQDGP